MSDEKLRSMLSNSGGNAKGDIQSQISFNEKHRRKHEQANSNLIDAYVEYQTESLREKSFYKKLLVAVCVLLLFVPVVMYGIIFWLVATGWAVAHSTGIVATIITSSISFIGAIKFLPEIIAKYCFDPEENNHLIQLISNTHHHDEEMSKRDTK